MEEVVVLEETKKPTFDELEDGQYFMLNTQGPIYRKVRWPSEKAYVIDVKAATIQMDTEYSGIEVIPLKVKIPLTLVHK